MNLSFIFLLFLASAPAAGLMWFIYWMDRHEPEALKDVLAAMAWGAASAVAALIVQLVFEGLPLFAAPGIAGPFFVNFLLVAPSEEFFKFFFIFLFLRNKRFYSEVNDGIVYYGAGALGFALLENIFYVFGYGAAVGVARAFTAIPIHTFCGVVIGYHAGLARFSRGRNPALLLGKGLFIAYFIHALYNTLLSLENALFILVLPLVVAVYLFGLRVIFRGRQISLAGGLPGFPTSQRARELFWSDEGEVAAGAWAAPTATAAELFWSDEAPAAGLAEAEAPAWQPAMAAAAAPAGAAAFVPPPSPFGSDALVNYRREEVHLDERGRRYLPPKRETWKALAGRFLFALIIIFWLLMFVGAGEVDTPLWELILGASLITVIPFLLATLLEFSYRRRRRVRLYIDPFAG